ncbi:MAG: penicillin-binding protein activator [Alphaproteobacteria bacterium]|nr:penicillin-binding protein activator [Alphaproteobacteria bacterium]
MPGSVSSDLARSTLAARTARALALAAGMILLAACAQNTPSVNSQTVPDVIPPSSTGAQAPSSPPFIVPSGPEGLVIGADTVRVALLVPLSGRAASVGSALRNAAEMALFDVADDRFALAIHDTRSTAPGAVAAARTAIADGAQLIIGPLFGGSTGEVGALARATGVPVLSFSNNIAVASNGVWVFGLLPADQVRRVVSYTAATGVRDFGAILPQSDYGNAVRAALLDATAVAGLPPPRIATYSPAAETTELAQIVKSFAAGYQPGAVLVPDGGAALRSIAPLLAFYDIAPETTHYLGTALWSDPSVGQEKTLIGGWFAAPSPLVRQDFQERYRGLFGEVPPGLASLGYDAVSMAAVLARQPGGPAFDAVSMTQPSGFLGADGVFRLLPDGGNQRGLAVLRVTQDGFEVEDPAPQSFELLIN